MKNIAIASAIHFKESQILFEKLNELAIEHKNVRFLLSSIDSSLEVVQNYALENFHLVHAYPANWNSVINADIERDKKMIMDADMLIVMDDSKSNRIKLLINWANEKQIPTIRIEVETKRTQNYTEVLKLKIVDPSDDKELSMKINQLELAKEQAINEREFEMAAIIRDRIRMIVNIK